jgi:hypothetical protein
MTNIVERLRGYVSVSWGSALTDTRDAADEIIRLRTERDNLRDEQEQCEDCDSAGKAAEIKRLRRLLHAVRCQFTRDDDLPDKLLPRIDKALKETK